jgi:hypothetical protein
MTLRAAVVRGVRAGAGPSQGAWVEPASEELEELKGGLVAVGSMGDAVAACSTTREVADAMDLAHTVYLVSCVSKKKTQPARNV